MPRTPPLVFAAAGAIVIPQFDCPVVAHILRAEVIIN